MHERKLIFLLVALSQDSAACKHDELNRILGNAFNRCEGMSRSPSATAVEVTCTST